MGLVSLTLLSVYFILYLCLGARPFKPFSAWYCASGLASLSVLVFYGRQNLRRLEKSSFGRPPWSDLHSFPQKRFEYGY